MSLGSYLCCIWVDAERGRRRPGPRRGFLRHRASRRRVLTGVCQGPALR